MTRSIGYYVCLAIFIELLWSPGVRCLGFWNVKKRDAVSIYGATLTPGSEDNRKNTVNGDGLENNTGLYEEALHASLSMDLHGVSPQPPGTSLNSTLTPKGDTQPKVKNTNESVMNSKELAIAPPAIPPSAVNQNFNTSGRDEGFRKGGSLEVIMSVFATTASTLNPAKKDEAVSNTMGNATSNGLNGSLAADVRSLKDGERNNSIDTEGSTLLTKLHFSTEEMLTANPGTKNFDSVDEQSTISLTLGNLTDVNVTLLSRLLDSMQLLTPTVSTISVDGERKPVSGNVNVEMQNENGKVTLTEVTLPNTNDKSDGIKSTPVSPGETVGSADVTQTQVLERSPFLLKSNASADAASNNSADSSPAHMLGTVSAAFTVSTTGTNVTDSMNGNETNTTTEIANATVSGEDSAPVFPSLITVAPTDSRLGTSLPQQTNAKEVTSVIKDEETATSSRITSPSRTIQTAEATSPETVTMTTAAAASVSAAVVAAAPSVRQTVTVMINEVDMLNSEEEEEEDEDEDESAEDENESLDFTFPNATPEDPMVDSRKTTKLEEMSYQVPDTVEWERQNQGLVRSLVEKLKDKAGYMSGMLVPVGVGIAGALFILGALYSIKIMNRRRKNGFKRHKRKQGEFNSMQDRVMLLADSSEDEF
ncbi:armadillo-like helical domain-containing protein 4 [Latimeria chalumnae]|uniref:armadillo-like helical domain-containing protein 4 n=1 Tax=Latimeria chalumnae TaxID=7897 RepID=UPI0003C12D14|nr:PREDICTED: uncharacterized protein C14orf37 homolog [Latimeria chalumnae]|eukprot:XP_005986510.1 PREDICTED: uncharacterized protein C14orf37 homolog [Latimeria chalumnae]